jgi:hypothetical protein
MGRSRAGAGPTATLLACLEASDKLLWEQKPINKTKTMDQSLEKPFLLSSQNKEI